MTLYPTVWPLPYGVTIRTDYSPEHNYSIPQSQTQCWPIKLDKWNNVLINCVHNSFTSNQAYSIKAWLGADPNGSNVVPPVTGLPTNIHLNGIGNSWCFYVAGTPTDTLPRADIRYIIDPDWIYYFMFQNCENKNNAYYARFTFSGYGSTMEL